MYDRAIIYRTKNIYRVQAHCVDEKGTPPILPDFIYLSMNMFAQR